MDEMELRDRALAHRRAALFHVDNRRKGYGTEDMDPEDQNLFMYNEYNLLLNQPKTFRWAGAFKDAVLPIMQERGRIRFRRKAVDDLEMELVNNIVQTSGSTLEAARLRVPRLVKFPVVLGWINDQSFQMSVEDFQGQAQMPLRKEYMRLEIQVAISVLSSLGLECDTAMESLALKSFEDLVPLHDQAVRILHHPICLLQLVVPQQPLPSAPPLSPYYPYIYKAINTTDGPCPRQIICDVPRTRAAMALHSCLSDLLDITVARNNETKIFICCWCYHDHNTPMLSWIDLINHYLEHSLSHDPETSHRHQNTPWIHKV